MSYLSPIAAGFQAPTDDYLVRVIGESMQNASIHPRDLLGVDRAIEPANGKIVIAVVNGELTVKRLREHRGKLWLMPENANFHSIEIDENTDLHIWGVVTNVIHAL